MFKTKNKYADRRKMITFIILFLLVAAIVKLGCSSDEIENVTARIRVKKYKPEWSDLDTRPLPEWFDRAKIGIFIHWGVYSVPSFHSEWFWRRLSRDNKEVISFMQKNYPPGFTYPEFAPMFKAEFFFADQFADLFNAAGAKYVVLTSKHHDGYSLFPSKRSFNWNSVDIGPHRDLVRDLSESIRAKGMKFGLYHSLYEWYNPMYLKDRFNRYHTRDYVELKLRPDIEQIINDYKPSVFWSDGDGEATDEYWNSTGLLAWMYNDSPVQNEIVVNDRWGKGIHCNHGDFFNCEDRYNPGRLLKHKWENAFTLDKHSWGYRRNMKLEDVMTVPELLKQVISTISCGGNALINVGPTKEGTIAPVFQERLLALGSWLKVNGEAIYSTSPWFYQNDNRAGDIWYTCTKSKYDAVKPVRKPNSSDNIAAIYAIFLIWPRTNILKLKYITTILHKSNYRVIMLGYDGFLEWSIKNTKCEIKLPDKATVSSEYAWTIKFIKVL